MSKQDSNIQYFSNRDILDKIVELNITDKDKLSAFYKIQMSIVELLDSLLARWLINEDGILQVAKAISNNEIPVQTEINGRNYLKENLYLQSLTKEIFLEMLSPEYNLETLKTLISGINHTKKEIYIVTPIFPIKEIANEIKKFKASSFLLKKTHTITYTNDNTGKQVVDNRNLLDYSFHIRIAPLWFMGNLLSTNESIEKSLNKWNKILQERARRSGFDTFTDEEHIEVVNDSLADLQWEMKGQVVKLIIQWEQWFDWVIASDIHIEPSLYHTWGYIRYRINWALSEPERIDNVDWLINEIKALSQVPTGIRNTRQDWALNIIINNKKYSYRLSFMPIGSKELSKQKLVMRELTDDISRLDLKKNKMDYRFREILERLLWAPKDGKVGKYKDWLFLMTGPTGSGKSTTIMSILNSLNTTDINIITLEDPIEYKIPGINQSQIFNADGNKEWVNPNEFYSFQEGIEAALRQDPDIIFIGEIRNATTMMAAKIASMTGHIVLSTLHTNNTFETLERIVGLWIEVDSISAFIRLIMAQRLASQVCNACKREYNDPIFSSGKHETARREIEYLRRKVEIYSALADSDYITELPDNIKDMKLYKWYGCSACNYTWLWKRVGIYEFLEVDNNLQEFLTKWKWVKKIKREIRNYYAEHGVVTLYQNALYKASKWIVYEELTDANGDAITMHLDYDSAISAAGWDIYSYSELYKWMNIKEIEKSVLQKKKMRELKQHIRIRNQIEDEIVGLKQFVESSNSILLEELHKSRKVEIKEITNIIAFLTKNNLVNKEVYDILLSNKLIKPKTDEE